MVSQKTAKVQQSQKKKKDAQASYLLSVNSAPTTKNLIVYDSRIAPIFRGTIQSYDITRASPKKRRKIIPKAEEQKDVGAADASQDTKEKEKPARKSQVSFTTVRCSTS